VTVVDDLATVRYSVDGPVGRVVMNRPEKRNALDHQLLDDIDAAFDAAEADPEVRVVVLSGAGPSFSAGYDLGGSYYTTEPEGGWTVASGLDRLRGIEDRYRRIWDFPKPTIAQVQGHALAGGCYLQMLCDISVAAHDATLGHPAVKMGGVSSMPLWQVLLGPKKARYLLMTGRTVDGREAEQMGLVSLSVPPEELVDTVEAIAAECAAIPASGQRHHKEALNTDLEIMGLGALFRYRGQMNALGRLRGGSPPYTT
jgi:enoyl-CoA hydratase